MFLIEYQEGAYINAEMIDWVEIKKGTVGFTLTGGNETFHRVDKDHQKGFVNHLQGLNTNISSVDAKYHNVNQD